MTTAHVSICACLLKKGHPYDGSVAARDESAVLILKPFRRSLTTLVVDPAARTAAPPRPRRRPAPRGRALGSAARAETAAARSRGRPRRRGTRAWRARRGRVAADRGQGGPPPPPGVRGGRASGRAHAGGCGGRNETGRSGPPGAACCPERGATRWPRRSGSGGREWWVGARRGGAPAAVERKESFTCCLASLGPPGLPLRWSYPSSLPSFPRPRLCAATRAGRAPRPFVVLGLLPAPTWSRPFVWLAHPWVVTMNCGA